MNICKTINPERNIPKKNNICDERAAVYRITNENIYLLERFIQPNERDRILSICGSGDILLMLLNNSAKVLAVDREMPQLRFTQRRIESLKEKDYKNFSGEVKDNFTKFVNNKILRNKYFESILKNPSIIIENLENLTFLHGDIFKLHENKRVELKEFNKVYLSNSVEYRQPFKGELFHKNRQYLIDFFNKFQVGTIFYFLMGDLTNIYAPKYKNIIGQIPNFKSEIKEGRYWTYCKCEKVA